MIKIELKDGAIIEVEKGSSIIDVAKKISRISKWRSTGFKT